MNTQDELLAAILAELQMIGMLMSSEIANSQETEAEMMEYLMMVKDTREKQYKDVVDKYEIRGGG